MRPTNELYPRLPTRPKPPWQFQFRLLTLIVVVLVSGPLLGAAINFTKHILASDEAMRDIRQAIVFFSIVGSGLLLAILVIAAVNRMPGQAAAFISVCLLGVLVWGVGLVVVVAKEELSRREGVFQEQSLLVVAWILVCLGLGGVLGFLARVARDDE